MRYLLFAAMLVTAPAAAHDEWTVGDTIAEGALVGLVAIDWYQTRSWIENNDPKCTPGNRSCTVYKEANPLLGPNPSKAKLDRMVAAGILFHGGVAYALPRGWRDAWQYVWIGAEIVVIEHNRSIGLKIPL